jgi:uncharacterized protein YfaP (DUF2135 family)
VQITSPQDGYTTDNRLLTVSGNVTSPNEINIGTGATVTLNGEARSLPLTLEGNSTYNYSFSTTLELIQGSNSITVTVTDSHNNSGNDTVIVNANIPTIFLRAELTWNTNDTDLDGHLIAPGYQIFDDFYDCYYWNRNPDWDGSGGNNTAGDPSLDQDITTGYGPEHTVLVAPPFNGIYQYKVHYYWDHGNGPSTATVKIWVNDNLVFQGNKTMSDNEVWDCACISWPSGVVSAGPCAITTPTPTPTPTPSLYALTVVSQGCCPILVEGLPAGNQTVSAGGNSTFSGIPANTQVTLTAQNSGNCSFDYWMVDGWPWSLVDQQITLTIDSAHTAEAWCSPSATPTPTPTPMPTPTTTPTPTPTPSGYTLTVTSQGCCPVLVKGLPGGDQTVPAGGNITFMGVSPGTLATIKAQPGVGCQLDHWMVDGVQKPADQTIYLTVNSNRTVIAVCVVLPPVTLTVTSEGCCSIMVSGLSGGNAMVPAGGTVTFTNVPANTLVTLLPQTGQECYFSYWTLDEQVYEGLPIEFTMDANHTVTVCCYGGEVIVP